jgi:hypothetical protein
MASLSNKTKQQSKMKYLMEITNNITFSDDNLVSDLGSSFDLIDQNESMVEALNHQDDNYQIKPADNKSYKIDKITIKREELQHIQINSLSEFMRSELLQYQIGK